MSTTEFNDLAGTWHDFYLTAGAAAATLVGLLFVGVSINIDAFTPADDNGLRLLAEQAFSNFVFVLLIALFVLIPNQGPTSLTIELAVVGVLGLVRIARRATAFRQMGTDTLGGWRYVLRRLGLAGVAGVALVLVAWSMTSNPITAFFWLLTVVLIYLTSAADSAWDLLIEVGRERRQVDGSGR